MPHACTQRCTARVTGGGGTARGERVKGETEWTTLSDGRDIKACDIEETIDISPLGANLFKTNIRTD